jgi:hypothetical protein
MMHPGIQSLKLFGLTRRAFSTAYAHFHSCRRIISLVNGMAPRLVQFMTINLIVLVDLQNKMRQGYTVTLANNPAGNTQPG